MYRTECPEDYGEYRIRQLDGDGGFSGEGYTLSWWEHTDESLWTRKHAAYPTLEDLFYGLIWIFEGKLPRSSPEKAGFCHITIECHERGIKNGTGDFSGSDGPTVLVAGPPDSEEGRL